MVWTFDLSDLTQTANSIKELLLEDLERRGLLNGTADQLSKRLVIVAHTPNLLGKLLSKILWKDEDKGAPRLTVFETAPGLWGDPE